MAVLSSRLALAAQINIRVFAALIRPYFCELIKPFCSFAAWIAETARHKKFHALRHTHATDLLAGGENIMEVTRRLGHSKASTTLDLYGHAIPGNDVKVAQKVAKLYKFEIEKDQSAQ